MKRRTGYRTGTGRWLNLLVGWKKYHEGSKYRFTIKPKRELILPPYKGSTFRGGFGHAFRHAVCVEREKECTGCSLRSKCVYSYVFETMIPHEEGKQQDKDVPHPFIIEPPIDERRHYGTDD